MHIKTQIIVLNKLFYMAVVIEKGLERPSTGMPSAWKVQKKKALKGENDINELIAKIRQKLKACVPLVGKAVLM